MAAGGGGVVFEGVGDGGALAGELFHDGDAAEGDVEGGVAAFVGEDEASVAELVGGFEELAGHFAEGGAVGHHAAEGVVHAAVEAGGDDDELGAEFAEGGEDDAFHGGEVGAVSGAGREGDVDVAAFAGAFADFAEVAAVAGEPLVLVEGDGEDAGVVVESLLGAVAVVDIPVDGGGALDAAFGEGVHDGDGGVGEDAEAAPAVAFGVVSGRADECVGVVDGAVEDGIDGGDGSAGGEEGDFVRAVGEGGALAGVAAVCGAEAADAVDVFGEMEA